MIDPTEQPAPDTAVCAVHEDAPSTGTCERCGDFVCPLCLDEFGPLPGHCEECREREGGGRIAFEGEGSLWSRWWRTTGDVLLRPTATFESARPGDLAASTRYVLLTGLAVGIPLSSLACCGATAMLATSLGTGLNGEPDPSVVVVVLVAALVYLLLLPVYFLVAATLRAAVFHAAVRLLGGTGGYDVSLWSTSYLSAVQVSLLPLLSLQVIPVVGLLAQVLALLVIETYLALQLTTVAHRYHGLEGGRAAMAGWAGLVVAVALFSLCVVGGVAIATLPSL